MKTYDERLHSIQKKAKGKKVARLFRRAAASLLCFVLIGCALVVLSQGGIADLPNFPVLNAPHETNPGSLEKDPYGTTTGGPIVNTPVFTSPSIPGNTQGPPSDRDEPYAILDFEAFYIHTNQASPCDTYPAEHLIRTFDELLNFCNSRYQEQITFEGINNYVYRYDESFFYENSLIVLMIEECSGSIRHNVVSVSMYHNNVVDVELERIVPEIDTDDLEFWYIIVQINAVLPEDTYISYQMTDLTPDKDHSEELVDLIPYSEQTIMKQAYIHQFTGPNEGYTVEDVLRFRVVAVLDQRYALFVDDNIFAYLDWKTGETVDGVEFKYCDSQKMYLYYDGHYYRLQEAFDAGLISHDDLLQIQENYDKGIGKLRFE